MRSYRLNKKSILSLSFGKQYPETSEKTNGATEKKISEEFPDYDVFRAFTSTIVRKRIYKNEGIKVDSIREALDKLKAQGYEEVYLQSLHIIPGIEYQLVQNAIDNYSPQFEKLVATPPLLDKFADYEQLVNFLEKQSSYLPSGKAI